MARLDVVLLLLKETAWLADWYESPDHALVGRIEWTERKIKWTCPGQKMRHAVRQVESNILLGPGRTTHAPHEKHFTTDVLTGRPELSSLSKEYTENAGGRGSMATVCFLKCWLWCIGFSYGVVKNQHFQSAILGGRESHKKVLCVRFW